VWDREGVVKVRMGLALACDGVVLACSAMAMHGLASAYRGDVAPGAGKAILCNAQRRQSKAPLGDGFGKARDSSGNVVVCGGNGMQTRAAARPRGAQLRLSAGRRSGGVLSSAYVSDSAGNGQRCTGAAWPSLASAVDRSARGKDSRVLRWQCGTRASVGDGSSWDASAIACSAKGGHRFAMGRLGTGLGRSAMAKLGPATATVRLGLQGHSLPFPRGVLQWEGIGQGSSGKGLSGAGNVTVSVGSGMSSQARALDRRVWGLSSLVTAVGSSAGARRGSAKEGDRKGRSSKGVGVGAMGSRPGVSSDTNCEAGAKMLIG